LAYQSSDTQQPLSQLERLMSDQVESLYHETGQPVRIVAESEGSLVAKTYLTASPHAPVDTLIMVSPLVQPARVYYPPAGVAGWGVVGGLGLQALSDTVGTETTVDLAPSQPFLRSIVQDAPALRSVLSCPVAGVRQYAVLPLADAVASGNAKPLGIPTAVVPAFHGGLLGDPTADAMIQDVLGGGTPSNSGLWSVAERVIGPASSAWQVPDLPLSINSAWSQPTSPNSVGGGAPSCSSIRTELAGQLAAG
jgi:alpha-beta hydrolase superfamily lysophospholipase